MSEAFDPYRKWLGIPPKDQPPHHYRLLGIAAFEDDPDVIDNAAARQMTHVKTFKASKHAAESQRLLSEISAAKLCLLNAESKATYDEQLRKQLAASGKLSSSQVVPPPVETALEPPATELPALPRVGSRWREEGLFETAPVGPVPLPIPMPSPAAVAAVALPAPFVPAPVFTGPPPPAAASVPMGKPVAAPAAAPVIRRSVPTSIARARRKQSSLPVIITVFSLLILATAGGIAVFVANLPDQSPPSSTPVQAAPLTPNSEQAKPPAVVPHSGENEGAASRAVPFVKAAGLPRTPQR